MKRRRANDRVEEWTFGPGQIWSRAGKVLPGRGNLARRAGLFAALLLLPLAILNALIVLLLLPALYLFDGLRGRSR